jgi:hypothetical protein
MSVYPVWVLFILKIFWPEFPETAHPVKLVQERVLESIQFPILDIRKFILFISQVMNTNYVH